MLSAWSSLLAKRVDRSLPVLCDNCNESRLKDEKKKRPAAIRKTYQSMIPDFFSTQLLIEDVESVEDFDEDEDEEIDEDDGNGD